MLSNSSDRMIPWDTCLSIDKRESLQEAISIREKSLSKSRLDIESSLWLMDELILFICVSCWNLMSNVGVTMGDNG